MKKPIWELQLSSDLKVVGHQEEEGYEIIREVYFLTAVDWISGRRFQQCAGMDKDAAEERLALMKIDGGVDPVRSHWDETYAVYGSQAYLDQEPEMVWNEKQANIADTAPIIGMRYDKKVWA